ncbi:hypothetical protein L7F22_063455 [Adiantum nelumboides]|nr:hypothetical protein [Adiantum nelumboides]
MALRGAAMAMAMMMTAAAMMSSVPAVRAQGDCTSLLGSLTPCLPFVADQEDAPSAACCSGLALVTQTNVSCLCVVLSSSSVPNITRAEELPALCNVSIPNPTSLCPAPPPNSGSPSPTLGSPPQNFGSPSPTLGSPPPNVNEDAMPPGMDMGDAFNLEPTPFLLTIASICSTTLVITLLEALFH